MVRAQCGPHECLMCDARARACRPEKSITPLTESSDDVPTPKGIQRSVSADSAEADSIRVRRAGVGAAVGAARVRSGSIVSSVHVDGSSSRGGSAGVASAGGPGGCGASTTGSVGGFASAGNGGGGGGGGGAGASGSGERSRTLSGGGVGSGGGRDDATITRVQSPGRLVQSTSLGAVDAVSLGRPLPYKGAREGSGDGAGAAAAAVAAGSARKKPRVILRGDLRAPAALTAAWRRLIGSSRST